jgi:HlyD family secretion protein
MSNSKKVVIAAVLLVAVASIAGIAMARGGDKGALVRTEAVVRRDLVSVVTASGKIEPKRKVDISADLSGRVTQVAVEEGQWVERGALLLRIDPTQYQSAVRRAEAAVAQARAREAQARAQLLKAQNDVRRAEMLAQGKELISAQDLDQARTQAQVAEAEMQAARFAVQQAQAAVSEARDNLSKTTIVAPMSGRVTRLNIEEGETAVIGTMNNPGSLLLTVADLSVMEAKIKVDETEVPNLGVGDSASVRIDAFPDREFSGRVTRIGNSAVQTAAAAASGADQQSVDFEVVITLDTPPAELRPDLSATADVVTDSRKNVLSVPIIALTVRDRDGKKFKEADEGDADAPRSAVQGDARARQAAEVTGVFVIKDGKAEWVPVQLGIAGDRYFEIRSGLKGGETVISGTYQAIRDLEDDAAVRTAVDSAAATAKNKKGAR